MNITDIRIRRTFQESRLRAIVSITIDNDVAIHDIKIIDGPVRLFVAMPNRKDDDGVFRDIAHPITAAARDAIEDKILAAYHEHMAKMADTELTADNAAENAE